MAAMTRSVSFDHAAETYDATRGESPEVSRSLTDALLDELRAAGAERVLEIGIGTGRITRPLAERGVRVAGIDIAPRMLAKLREQLAAGATPPDLAIGDVTALPFAGGAFRAALAVHVLHLVSSWQRTLEELRRVLAPGGVYLHHYTRYAEPNPWTPSLRARDEVLDEMQIVRRPRPSEEQIEEKLRALGAAGREAVYYRGEEQSAPRDWLERARDRIDSWTWEVPEALHPAFMERYEARCRELYGDLDRVHPQPVQHELHVWIFP